ncbi:MAG: hypothetical protein ACAH80_15480 [Alphaproteobacteria bacterium]
MALASVFSTPAIAETVMECAYTGTRRPSLRAPVPQYVEPVATPWAGLDGMLGISVIYPGIIVMMTMAAYYFLRQLEPQTVHDHPRFVRTAVALSSLWLLGFFPFLSSASGGFMFCVTAMSCTGAWLMMRSFEKPLKFTERMFIFWGFFFFSLFLSVLVTGRGEEIAALFNQPVTQLLAVAGEFTRHLGPLLLLALNGWVALRVFRLMGVKVSRPGNPETVKRIKVAGMAAAIVIFDIMMMETRFQLATLLPLLLWAAPAVAYYGVYRLVASMSPAVRGRVSPALFATLAVFLTVLVCLSAGASLQAMLLAALVLGLMASAGYSLPLLWKSALPVAVRATVTTVAALVFLGGSWLVFSLAGLPEDILALYIGEVILPVLLSWKAGAVVLPLCLYASYVVLSGHGARAKFAVASVTILLLLLAYTGASMTGQSLVNHKREPFTPADILKQESQAQQSGGEYRLECKKVRR